MLYYLYNIKERRTDMREVSLNIGFGEWMECNLVQYIYTEEKTYAVLIQKNQEVLIVEVLYNTSWKHIVYFIQNCNFPPSWCHVI